MFHETLRGKGQLSAQGIGKLSKVRRCAYFLTGRDDALRTCTLNAIFELSGSRRCRIRMTDAATGKAFDLRGILAADSRQIQGSAFDVSSRTSHGPFCLIYAKPCTMVQACHDYPAANHRKPCT